MKKWTKRVGVLVVVGLVVMAGVLAVSARLILTKEFLVSEIEGSINSRVEIGELDVSLFSVPAKVVLRDVVLAKRDAVVAAGEAYGDRPALSGGVILCKELSFEVSLWQLLSREIYVDSVAVEGLHASVVLHEDGTNSLDRLFDAPPKVGKAVVVGDGRDGEVTGSGGFNAQRSEDFVTELKSVVVRDASFDVEIEESGVFLVGSGCSVRVADIKVDPNALEMVNEAALELVVGVKVYDSREKKVRLGELELRGPAAVRLFDPVTGNIDPDLKCDLVISKESSLNMRAPYVVKLWQTAKKLEKVGVKLGSLPERASFGRGRRLKADYHRGRVDLLEDVSVLVHDWEIAANGKSWFESGSDEHEFLVDISASEKTSKSLVGHFDKLLRKVPKEMRGELEKTMKKDWLRGGKLTLRARTSGKLASPKVKVLTEFPDVEKLLKDFAKKSAMDYLLRKLR